MVSYQDPISSIVLDKTVIDMSLIKRIHSMIQEEEVRQI